MASLGVGKDPLKRPLGWIAEKVGRLKLNGELRRRSPLSPGVPDPGTIAHRSSL